MSLQAYLSDEAVLGLRAKRRINEFHPGNPTVASWAFGMIPNEISELLEDGDLKAGREYPFWLSDQGGSLVVSPDKCWLEFRIDNEDRYPEGHYVRLK